MTKAPGLAGTLADHLPKKKGGRKSSCSPKMLKQIAEYVEQRRSQRDIAELMDVDQASVSRWLKAATRQVTVEEITESTDLIYQLRAGEFTADGKLIEDVDESGCGSVEWTEKV